MGEFHFFLLGTQRAPKPPPAYPSKGDRERLSRPPGSIIKIGGLNFTRFSAFCILKSPGKTTVHAEFSYETQPYKCAKLGVDESIFNKSIRAVIKSLHFRRMAEIKNTKFFLTSLKLLERTWQHPLKK
jgi:hypothetical protein